MISGLIMEYIRTVLGEIKADDLGIVLPHEHICSYYEPFYMIAKEKLFDKKLLKERAIQFLTYMKEHYKMDTIVDCTPINTGRDVDLLKEVSGGSGVNIVASSGFYYTEEVMLYLKTEDFFYDMLMYDIENTNAGILKFAVDSEQMTPLNRTMLSALCRVQKEVRIPLCIHTNSFVRNGIEIADFVLEQGVQSGAVTIAHMMDSDDNGYITEILDKGVYAGFDRFYKREDREYIGRKVKQMCDLYRSGYGEKIIFSHDTLLYNEFCKNSVVERENPYTFIFTDVLPIMKEEGFSDNEIFALFRKNPRNMLCMVG